MVNQKKNLAPTPNPSVTLGVGYANLIEFSPNLTKTRWGRGGGRPWLEAGAQGARPDIDAGAELKARGWWEPPTQQLNHLLVDV